MFYRFNCDQQPVFLSFENCSEEMTPFLLLDLRPLLLDFCLKHKCFYFLYSKPAVSNMYSFGLDFYFSAPDKSHKELFTSVKDTFVNYFSKKGICEFVNCFRHIPIKRGFFKVFQPVMHFDHFYVVIKKLAIPSTDLCFSLLATFDLNRVVFLPKRKIFVINQVAYLIEREDKLIFLIQNDENFKSNNVIDFIKKYYDPQATVRFYKRVKRV
jgi:hypothetical protein